MEKSEDDNWRRRNPGTKLTPPESAGSYDHVDTKFEHNYIKYSREKWVNIRERILGRPYVGGQISSYLLLQRQ